MRSATDMSLGRTVEILVAGKEWVKGHVVTQEQGRHGSYLIIEMMPCEFMPLPDRVVVSLASMGTVWRDAGQQAPPRDITPKEQPHAAIESQGAYRSEPR